MTGAMAGDTLTRAEIETRLSNIIATLDEIGTTTGMERARRELRAERDRLLDRLLATLAEEGAAVGV